jgi:hypothetical protein
MNKCISCSLKENSPGRQITKACPELYQILMSINDRPVADRNFKDNEKYIEIYLSR